MLILLFFFTLSSIICDVTSLIFVVYEIYHNHFYPEVKNVMFLTVLCIIV